MPYFNVYNPANFGWTADASQIIPYSYNGVSFPAGVHRLAKAPFDGLLKKLLDEDMVPGGLKNPGCWGYEYRPVTGNSSGLSYHAYGLALDINAPANGYRANGSAGPHSISNSAGALARSLGFEWGGAWTSPKDYMHFELHLSPAEIRAAPPSAGSSADVPATIRAGSTGTTVATLQRRLYLPVGTPPAFGPVTTAAVEQYQRVHGLAADGIVGPATWAALLHSAIRPGERQLRQGSTGDDVAWLQRKLNLKPATHPAFGPITTKAVDAFHRLWKSTPTGIVSPPDWRRLGVAHADVS